jgi:excisionase family DNA binding protein
MRATAHIASRACDAYAGDGMTPTCAGMGSEGAMSDDVPRLMLTVPQFARACQMGTTKCWGLVRAGVIPCVRFGRSVRIPMHELEAWIAAQSGGTADVTAPAASRPERRRRVAGRGRVR